MDDEAARLALVYLALTCGLSNCVEWRDDEVARQARSDPRLQGFTARGLKELLIDWVKNQHGTVEPRQEMREEFQSLRPVWYRVRVPVPGIVPSVFFELGLEDEDPDCPEVVILSCHT